ncbi:hypothetical protein EDD28_1117 [Salana multivorans]|uniref:DUF1684 domain-containing protein n=1 Tax=Salana multivorans TaxID=120377 RepID=A0A3N2DA19_9MICO|nr:DUF1684 domain-containing protein [Salana multivorans]ROR96532.1 hypothetical protein EDD28_1117 [Salana multivorans]
MAIDTETGDVTGAPGAREEPEELAAAWREFRAARETALARPHDWLSVAGLEWVGEEPARLGRVPGTWWEVDGVLHMRAASEDGLRLLGSGSGSGPGDGPSDDSVLLDGELTLVVEEGGAQPFALFGDRVRVDVLRRGGYYGLRLRDPAAPALRDFTGVPTWDYDPDWRLPVRLEPYPAPRVVVVGSAAPGLTQRASAVGEVVLVLRGVEHRLVATGRHGSWSVSFSDATSGTESAAWRAVAVEGDPDTGHGVLDLNRAVNYPYAFSDYGTCPAPVPGNALPIPVTAGERAPSGRTGVPPASGGPAALPGPQLLGGAVPD